MTLHSKWRIGLVVACLCIACAALGAWWFAQWVERPLNVRTTQIIQIEPGASMLGVLQSLERQQLLDHARLAAWWAQQQDMAHRIQTGEYLIEPGITLPQLLAKFVNGDVIYHDVALIEGMTLDQVYARLQGADFLAQDLRPLDSALDLEGYLYPDTYRVRRGESAQALLERAHQKMTRLLEQVWAQAPETTLAVLHSPYELLILASVVEKETGQDEDRKDIAQVFHNRLNKGMRLQSDPTVIFGIGADFDGNLTRTHLRTDTPYNSYTRAGLPPTPIAIPSKASLEATAHPSTGDLLYFVATGDGGSVFSRTLEEHNRAVRRYQLRQAAQ